MAVLFFPAACAPPEAFRPLTPVVATPAAASTRLPLNAPGTLPPTWTPTFTPSGLPPSATPTPTFTPTPVPTESIETLCVGFRLLHDFDRQGPFAWEAAIPLLLEVKSPDVVMRFLAVRRRGGANQGVQIPGGQTIIANFPVRLLPGPGLYDWRLSLYSEAYGELCPLEGTFVVLRPRPAAPEATEPPDS